MKYDNEKKERLRKIESGLIEWDFPPQIIIETTSYCNMQCFHCNHKIMKRPLQHMASDLYQKIIDEISNESPNCEVWPTFYGEAFMLGEELFRRLRYARDKGLTDIVLNSNGILLDHKGWIDEILTSGLKRLIFSLDGFTKETFEKIRVGGKRDKIYKSIEMLLKRRKEMNLEYPGIQCQFSIMDQNKHEVNQFKEYWESLGAEVKTRQMLSWTNSGDTELKIKAPNLDYDADYRITCPWGNNTLAVHANGNIVACAVDYEGLFVAGNIGNSSIKEIWKGPLLNKLRNYHRQHQWELIPEICKKCPDWQAVGAEYHTNEQAGYKEGTRPFWHPDYKKSTNDSHFED